MKINHQIMRGYDIRGVVGTDLNEGIMEAFGKAYGTYMIRHGEYKAIIGNDSRKESPAFKEAFIKGLLSTGMDVIDLGLLMVGTIYWSQYHFNTKAAAMITASHNPKEYNGVKLARNYSESMILQDLKEIIRQIETEDFIKAEIPGTLTQIDIRDAYFEDIIKRTKFDQKFKAVVDPSCTTAGAIVPDLLRRAGCEVIESNCELDPSFPLGVADPTETIVAERLSAKVRECGSDIGFSYDSDGDRIGIVDENGAIIWNDVLVAIFAIDVLSKHPHSKIMFNTLCSKVVSDTISKYGGEPFMWRTGHGFLKKKNQEVGCPFIGELSGHFFFSADFYNHDDGCYVTLKLLEYLSRSKQTLGQAVANLPAYISSPEIKIYCDDDKKIKLMEKISPILKKDYPQAEVIEDERAGDGVRLEMPEAMFIIRYSQNGPYLTIKFEAKTQEEYDKLKKYINTLLHSFPEIDWNNEIRVNVEALQ
jgi:phosphomannomutase / phosphoglucomutase